MLSEARQGFASSVMPPSLSRSPPELHPVLEPAILITPTSYRTPSIVLFPLVCDSLSSSPLPSFLPRSAPSSAVLASRSFSRPRSFVSLLETHEGESSRPPVCWDGPSTTASTRRLVSPQGPTGQTPAVLRHVRPVTIEAVSRLRHGRGTPHTRERCSTSGTSATRSRRHGTR